MGTIAASVVLQLFIECRTKSPLDIIPPAKICIGGQNMRYNIQGGIQYRGDYVRLTKFMGGFCPPMQILAGGIMSRGGFCPDTALHQM